MSYLQHLLKEVEVGDELTCEWAYPAPYAFTQGCHYTVVEYKGVKGLIDNQGEFTVENDVWFFKRTNYMKLTKLPETEIEDGFYEVCSNAQGKHSQRVHLRGTGNNLTDGVNRSYHVESPHPDSACSNYGGYKWRPSWGNRHSCIAYIRPLMGFEIIAMKFAMYGWCKMSEDSFFNRDYISGEREFKRR